MKVEDFIRKYNKTSDIDTFISNRITTTYLPYEEKITLCDRVVQATCYKEVEGKRIFWMNTPAQFMLFSVALIETYTDIELSENVIDDFNALDQQNLITKIIATIPENEYATIRGLLDMIINDIRENERDLVSWIEGKKETLNIVAESFFDMLAEMNEAK